MFSWESEQDGNMCLWNEMRFVATSNLQQWSIDKWLLTQSQSGSHTAKSQKSRDGGIAGGVAGKSMYTWHCTGT